jgi:transcriptional regulator with XRE-family HTH domain
MTILNDLMGTDPELQQLAEQERLNARVAQMIYDARMGAKLTQKQLAERVGTTQSVIARLEDSDYEGHSLTMLARVAQAMDLHLQVRLTSKKRRNSSRGKPTAS